MQDESRDRIWVTPAIHSSMYIWPVSSHLFRSESRWLNPMQEKKKTSTCCKDEIIFISITKHSVSEDVGAVC